MANSDTQSNTKPDGDLFTPGALLLGGGALAFFGARWLRARLSRLADLIAPSRSGAAPTVEPAPAVAPAPTPSTTAPAAPTPTAPPTTPVPSSGAPSSSGEPVSRKLDAVFARYAGSIPVEYLRSLASRESGLNPAERSGPAWGVMQVIETVRNDFNRRHRTAYSREALLDPAVNVAIGADLLRLIVASYARHHPDIPNLRTDWRNPRFVELVTYGWNAGFSEGGGVGRVAKYLAARGVRDLTIDTVYQHAKAAGASRHLSNEAKVKWCKGVTALYMRERARAERERVDSSSFPVG